MKCSLKSRMGYSREREMTNRELHSFVENIRSAYHMLLVSWCLLEREREGGGLEKELEKQ